MPELPEVETTAAMLNRLVTGKTIVSLWTDYGSQAHLGKGNIKDKTYFAFFKKSVSGRKILSVSRRAKNVLIHLSGDVTILVHMKMTGHLLYGKYIYRSGKWIPPKDGKLDDPFNRFIHLAFSLSDGKTLVLCDMRKFAKVYLLATDELASCDDLKHLGPEPLEKNFTYSVFHRQLAQKPNGKIKSVLLDQTVIAGIGNIYSDEALWFSDIHPVTQVKNIPEKKLKALYANIKTVLRFSLKTGGDSMSDYRNPLGSKGMYQNLHKAYRRTGEHCAKKGCEGVIRRQVIGGRSAHYCSVHQK